MSAPAIAYTHQPDPWWFATLRDGDVIASPKGTQRVVRKVSRDDAGRLKAVYFAIKRCSWTKRPYTVYVRSDLRQGWRYVGVRVKLVAEIDWRIRHACNSDTDRSLSCRDVRGLP